MSTNVTLNGVTYAIPAEGDSGWGTVLSNYFIAIASSTLQKTGGTFTLTAEANFGATYGLKSAYLKSQATNPSATGIVRLGNAELVAWRNAANNADLGLTVSADNLLQFNGSSILMPGLGSIVNADVNASAAIAYSKLNLTGAILNADLAGSIAYSKLTLTGAILNADLAGSIAYSKLSLTGAILNADLAGSIAASKLVGTDIATVGTITTGTWSATAIALNKITAVTASRALVSDVSGFVSASSVTGTELGYLSGVTSAIQTQLNAALSNPMDAIGQIIYGGASGVATKLAAGTAGQVLESAGGAAPVWGNRGVPTGAVQMYGGATAPTGWLLCDGSAVSRSTYAELFAILSTTYGVGDGSTTFNVPDARGVFVRGAGSQTISAISYTGTRGTTEGDQVQGHKHGLTDPGHTHTYERPNHSTDATAGVNRITSINDTTTATSSSTTGITINTPTTDGTNGTPRTGSETRPANISLSYIIKT